MLSALIGSISFSGSMVAFAKLQELLSGRPITYPGQQIVNLGLFAALIAGGIAIVAGYEEQWVLVAMVLGALVFGVLFVLPIGGADMPVVISLLNAFTGLAAAATGFELGSNVLIVSGALVGASGTLLTMMMGKAMNRSLGNVLFGAFGQVQAGAGSASGGDRHRPLGERRGRRDHALLRAEGRDRARVRAWRSRRRSTRCASWPTCSRRRGSR